MAEEFKKFDVVWHVDHGKGVVADVEPNGCGDGSAWITCYYLEGWKHGDRPYGDPAELFSHYPPVKHTANEYQVKAMRTCSINDNDKDKLLHGVFGLNSEAGEIAGLFQKEYQGHQIDKEHLVKECGDALWMIAEILDAIGVDLETCMMKNIEKLRARYPDGFDPEKSLHRKPGDV